MFYPQLFCCINMANIIEFPSKDGNITPEKACKSRQMQFHNKTAYVWIGILPFKKRVNCGKCIFATKQRMVGVFAIDEILRYRRSPFPASCTLCHPGHECTCFLFWIGPNSSQALDGSFSPLSKNTGISLGRVLNQNGVCKQSNYTVLPKSDKWKKYIPIILMLQSNKPYLKWTWIEGKSYKVEKYEGPDIHLSSTL